MCSVPGSGSSLGGGNGNSLQCSCLETPTDRGVWATVHGVTESWTHRAYTCKHACAHTHTHTHTHTQGLRKACSWIPAVSGKWCFKKKKKVGFVNLIPRGKGSISFFIIKANSYFLQLKCASNTLSSGSVKKDWAVASATRVHHLRMGFMDWDLFASHWGPEHTRWGDLLEGGGERKEEWTVLFVHLIPRRIKQEDNGHHRILELTFFLFPGMSPLFHDSSAHKTQYCITPHHHHHET